MHPEATACGVFLRHHQPLPPLNPFYSLMMDSPALRLKHGGDPAIPIPSILPSKASHRLRQGFFSTTGLSLIPLS